MTPGVTQETVDGMSLGKIGRIIDACATSATGSARARRVWIPKRRGAEAPRHAHLVG